MKHTVQLIATHDDHELNDVLIAVEAARLLFQELGFDVGITHVSSTQGLQTDSGKGGLPLEAESTIKPSTPYPPGQYL